MPEIGGREVGPVGFGMLGLTWRASPPPEADALTTLRAALATSEHPILLNGGEFYGPPTANSLTLLRTLYTTSPALASRAVLNVKGGAVPGTFTMDCTRAGIRASVERCLAQLGPVGKIDMFEPARRDPKVEVRETMQALGELVEEGKIGGVALSEVSAKTIREAVRWTKVVAVEVELSLFETAPLRNGVLEACRENGIVVIAYSPVGRGMLTGTLPSATALPANDVRHTIPRFQGANLEHNLGLARAVEAMAKEAGCTPAQFAIGWLLALSAREDMPTIIPIPGTTSVERVRENAGARALGEEAMERVGRLLEGWETRGDRYPEWGMKLLDG